MLISVHSRSRVVSPGQGSLGTGARACLARAAKEYMTSRMTKFVLFLFIIHCSCSLLTVTYVKAETVSLLRRAPWQYEAIEGNHDEAVATALLRNEINETGCVKHKKDIHLIDNQLDKVDN